MRNLCFLVVALGLATTAACSSAPPALPQPTPDVRGTITAAVAGTVTALTVAVSATATAQAFPTPAPTPAPVTDKWVVASAVGSWPAAIDIDATFTVSIALISGDYRPLNTLRMAGRVFDVNDGDRLVLLEKGAGGLHVRMTSGNYPGKIVWLPENVVRQNIFP